MYTGYNSGHSWQFIPPDWLSFFLMKLSTTDASFLGKVLSQESCRQTGGCKKRPLINSCGFTQLAKPRQIGLCNQQGEGFVVLGWERVPYMKFTRHPVHKLYETGLKNYKSFCWKCLYSLTTNIDFSDLHSISGEELITKEENLSTSYMELFPYF